MFKLADMILNWNMPILQWLSAWGLRGVWLYAWTCWRLPSAAAALVASDAADTWGDTLSPAVIFGPKADQVIAVEGEDLRTILENERGSNNVDEINSAPFAVVKMRSIPAN